MVELSVKKTLPGYKRPNNRLAANRQQREWKNA